MMSCPLCLSSQADVMCDYPHADRIRRYWLCDVCGLIFIDPSEHLLPEEEKGRYDLHRNDLSDSRYIEYLQRFIDPLKVYLKSGMTGLDFGCGVVDGIAQLLSKEGLKMSAYDPFYFPSKDTLNQSYDLIACCEAAEHFYDPRKEFDLFDRMLNPGGILAIQTNVYDETIDFSTWWYVRDPTHVSFYQAKTFGWIADFRGWNIIACPKNTAVFRKS